MNNPVTSTEIEAVIKKQNKTNNNKKKLQKNRSPGLNGSTREFYETFREELVPNLLKLFKKLQKEHFQTHSTRPPSPGYQNQTKTTQEKKTIGQNW